MARLTVGCRWCSFTNGGTKMESGNWSATSMVAFAPKDIGERLELFRPALAEVAAADSR